MTTYKGTAEIEHRPIEAIVYMALLAVAGAGILLFIYQIYVSLVSGAWVSMSILDVLTAIKGPSDIPLAFLHEVFGLISMPLFLIALPLIAIYVDKILKK